MRKTLIIILLIFGFTNCKNEKTDSDKNLIKKNHLPLFLGLSPKMTDKDFKDEINNLNISGKLNKGSFIVKVKDEEYHFRVYKYKDAICLTNNKQINFAYTDYDEYEKGKEQSYRKLNDFIDKIEAKYKGKRNESLTYTFFEEWILEGGDCGYGVYRDSSKTVVLRYCSNCDEYVSGQYSNTFSTYKNGLVIKSGNVTAEIFMAYYYNEDFDKLIEKKTHNKVIREQNKIEEFKKKIEHEKVLENNLNDL